MVISSSNPFPPSSSSTPSLRYCRGGVRGVQIDVRGENNRVLNEAKALNKRESHPSVRYYCYYYSVNIPCIYRIYLPISCVIVNSVCNCVFLLMCLVSVSSYLTLIFNDKKSVISLSYLSESLCYYYYFFTIFIIPILMWVLCSCVSRFSGLCVCMIWFCVEICVKIHVKYHNSIWFGY